MSVSKDSIKILAIGNSFSDNAMNQLYPIIEAFGVKEIILGNMYIGGCSLERHYNNLINNSYDYIYRKNTNQTKTFINHEWYNLSKIIDDEKWDVITFQQASDFSGDITSYKEEQLNTLISWAKDNVIEKDVIFGWHMTWAYQENSTHPAFPKYNNDQMFMYQSIVSSVKEKIETNENIKFVIPAGTAIQNARTSYIGDNLTIDGYHLNPLGEYIIGLTWVLSITGWDINDFHTELVSEEFKPYIKVIIESAKNAVSSPYKITKSVYTK